MDLTQHGSTRAVALFLALAGGLVLIGAARKFIDLWLARLQRRWEREDQRDDR